MLSPSKSKTKACGQSLGESAWLMSGSPNIGRPDLKLYLAKVECEMFGEGCEIHRTDADCFTYPRRQRTGAGADCVLKAEQSKRSVHETSRSSSLCSGHLAAMMWWQGQ